MSIFVCKDIGSVPDRIKIEHKLNCDGTYYYRASTRIGSILGSDDLGDGAPIIEGFGLTEDIARERLGEELKKFNDSLWDE